MRGRINRRLGELLPDENMPPAALHRAMRYSLLAPGKRLRPILTLLTADAFGAPVEKALDPACAVELVHTSSLILDDLPCMDDARVRRGLDTCHRAFGQDIAILAAVALLNRAYGVTSRAPGLDDSLRLELTALLVRTIGDEGIVAGQVLDLQADGGRAEPHEVEQVADQKTGALFVAAAEIGARVAGVPQRRLENVRDFARNLGTCFQILDDLADHQATEQAAGKDVGQDLNKTTFVSLTDDEPAKEKARRFAAAAKAALRPLGAARASLTALVDDLFAPPQAGKTTRRRAPKGRPWVLPSIHRTTRGPAQS